MLLNTMDKAKKNRGPFSKPTKTNKRRHYNCKWLTIIQHLTFQIQQLMMTLGKHIKN